MAITGGVIAAGAIAAAGAAGAAAISANANKKAAARGAANNRASSQAYLDAIGDIDSPEFIAAQFKHLKLDKFTTGLDDYLKQGKYVDRVTSHVANIDSKDNAAFQSNVFGTDPNLQAGMKQQSEDALSLLSGELPQDVQDSILRSSAFKSIAGGYQGSNMGRNLSMRDLGRTSLDAVNQGASLLNQSYSMATGLNPFRTSSQNYFFTPQELLTRRDGLAQYNNAVDNAQAQENAHAFNMNSASEYQHELMGAGAELQMMQSPSSTASPWAAAATSALSSLAYSVRPTQTPQSSAIPAWAVNAAGPRASTYPTPGTQPNNTTPTAVSWQTSAMGGGNQLTSAVPTGSAFNRA